MHHFPNPCSTTAKNSTMFPSPTLTLCWETKPTKHTVHQLLTCKDLLSPWGDLISRQIQPLPQLTRRGSSFQGKSTTAQSCLAPVWREINKSKLRNKCFSGSKRSYPLQSWNIIANLPETWNQQIISTPILLLSPGWALVEASNTSESAKWDPGAVHNQLGLILQHRVLARDRRRWHSKGE